MAGLSVLIQLSGIIQLPIEVPSEGTPVWATVIGDQADSSIINRVSGRIAWREGLAEYDQSVRPMFNVISMSPSASQAELLAGQQIVLPVLKGVLTWDAGRKAVFTREPIGSDYILVGVGEAVSDYRIDTIGQDFVTAVSPTGEEVRFELRGAGEGH